MIDNWAVSTEDQDLITAIAHRAHVLSRNLGQRGDDLYTVRDAMMDVTATHNNAVKLALRRLLHASDGEFAHDVFGIRRYLDRDNGTLGCFTPRFRA